MGKLLSQLSHGGFIRQEDAKDTVERNGSAAETVTDFDYLFPELAKDPDSLLPIDNTLQTITQLKALGDAMIDASNPVDPEQTNSTIPSVYTYWGQFLDHDITAKTDRNAPELETDITEDDFKPRSPDFVTKKLKNLRQPTLDLDSVYGDGPTLDSANPTRAQAFYQEEGMAKLTVKEFKKTTQIRLIKRLNRF